MSNYENDLDLLDPTDEDLLSAVEDDLAPITEAESDDYWNMDENVHDDRYDGDGIPSWSAWS